MFYLVIINKLETRKTPVKVKVMEILQNKNTGIPNQRSSNLSIYEEEAL